MTLDLTTIVMIVLAVALIAIIVWQVLIEKRIAKLTRGNTKNSLEEILAQHLERTDILTNWCEELDKKHTLRDKQFASSIKGIGYVRYNPYDDEGPRQSFALALVNSTGDGILLSSISARDKMRVFAKQLNSFVSEQELTAEETSALDQARTSLDRLTQR